MRSLSDNAIGGLCAMALATGSAQSCVLEIQSLGAVFDGTAHGVVSSVRLHGSVSQCNESAEANYATISSQKDWPPSIESASIKCLIPDQCTPPDPQIVPATRTYIILQR